LLLAGLVQAVALVSACGSGDGGGSGHGGSAGTSEAGTPSEAGAENSNGGSDTGSGGGGNTEGGATTTPQGGVGDGTTTPAPEFEGVDLDGLTLEPTPGCEGGYDVATKTLTLNIDDASRTALIDALGGTLRANGRVCTAPDGTEALAADIDHINLTGTSGDDTVIFDLLDGDFGRALTATAAAISIDLGDGDDSLALRATRDDDHISCTLNSLDFVGSGKAALRFEGAESLVVSLGPGNDSFNGAPSSMRCNVPVTVYGGAGSDTLQGGAMNDVLNGGEGSDEIDMGSSIDGDDIVNGGPEDDLVSYAKRNNGVNVTLCSASALNACDASECDCQPISGESGEHDTIVNLEDVDGGAGADTLTGDEGANVLSGKDGNDTLNGMGGTDQIYGDAGDDIVNGGADSDILMGGTGKNTIDGGDGDDICFVSPRDNKLKNCETPIDTQ
jgi:Ca2+-binding RTX toxin-like protein